MILYTSGTTSKPKGVVTTHACIQNQIESLVQAWHWKSDDRIPLFLPLHHVHGIINILSCALYAGAKIEPFDRFDLDTILGRVTEDAYSVFMAVPTIYVKLIEAIEAMGENDRKPIIDGFAKMRLMISGSAALPASVHQRWTQLTGQKLLERYGMTEIGMALSNPYQGERRPGYVGTPLPGVKIRLQSDAGETITEEGIPGEIQVQGDNVFREYFDRPEATEESFINGWFRTGDVAVIENGYFRIMGRTSIDIIKSGGYKLSALEIEASLLDHPAITECAVVGIADQTWGETVAAAVVLRGDQTLELDSLQVWCKDRISPYKIPRHLLAVKNLPRNALGKVTKPDVTKLFQ
jgi:malonyl-CoA/methylmalonyl-CoA synthetase